MTQIANNLSLVTNINPYKCVRLYEFKIVVIYTLSISKTSRPLIISAYRTKIVLIALIATKLDNDY